MHVLKNTKGALSIVFDAGDADTNAVTVHVVNAAGVVVIASANATHDATTAGRYTYTLPPQADVACLTVTWSGVWGGVAMSVDTRVDIVGSMLFTLAQLRDFDDGKLASSTFTDEFLSFKRDEITDDFEQICNVSFVRKYARDTLSGEDRRNIYLMHRRPIRLISVTVNGVALSAGDVAALTLYESGKLERSTLWPYSPSTGRNVVVEYEHGYPMPPLKIAAAAKILARSEIITSDIGDRTLSVSNDLGVVRLSVPGEKYPTGIPVVDAALERYDESSTLEAF